MLYITKLANVFFTSVVENGKEFRRIFTKNSSASGDFKQFVVILQRCIS